MAASFDCAKASTKHEKMICDNPELNEADEEMGNIYRENKLKFKHFPKAITSEQKSFLTKNNSIWNGKEYIDYPSYNKCLEVKQCLFLVTNRIKELKNEPLSWIRYSKELRQLIKSSIPVMNVYMGMTKNEKKTSLVEAMFTVTGAGDNVQLRDKRFLTIDGFRQHDAYSKGFIWIDLETEKKVYVIRAFQLNEQEFDLNDGVYVTFTSGFDKKQIPKEFYKDFKEWEKRENLDDNNIKSIFL